MPIRLSESREVRQVFELMGPFCGLHRGCEKLARIQDLQQDRLARFREVDDYRVHLFGMVYGLVADLVHQDVVFCLVGYLQ